MDRAGLDVADGASVTDAIARHRPDAVVHCTAWTAVDDPEAAEEHALAVNADGAASLAVGCAAAGARMVQVGTNYVFAGECRPTVTETTSQRRAQRTGAPSWRVSGPCSVGCPDPATCGADNVALWAHGPNFVRTMIRLEGQRPTVDVVDHQHAWPTRAADVASQLIVLIHSAAPPGIYHATSSGQTTWFRLARKTLSLPGRLRLIPPRFPGSADTAVPVSASSARRPRPRGCHGVPVQAVGAGHSQ